MDGSSQPILNNRKEKNEQEKRGEKRERGEKRRKEGKEEKRGEEREKKRKEFISISIIVQLFFRLQQISRRKLLKINRAQLNKG